MTVSGILAVGILCAVIVTFITDRLPMCAVALLGGAAMAVTGILSPEEVFAGLSSSAVLYLIGMGIVSQALINAGYIEYIRRLFLRSEKASERKLILLFILVFAAVSALFQGIVIMLMIMPVICAMEKSTEGRISRKQMYLPLGIASLFGGNFTIIGSSSMLNAVKQAENFTGQKIALTAPFWMGSAAVLVLLLFYALVGEQVQRRVFTFESPPILYMDLEQEETIPEASWRRRCALVVFLGCIVAFLAGVDTGFVSIVAAALLIAMGCISLPAAIHSVDWSVAFTVTGCMAIGKGIECSGAGIYLADLVFRVTGRLGNSPFAMCVLMLTLTSLISNFMSNNAAVTITVPIAMSIAVRLGADPVVFALACGVGANLAVATPMSTTVTAVMTSAGYRFGDYVKVGGFLNVLAVAAVSAALGLFYF